MNVLELRRHRRMHHAFRRGQQIECLRTGIPDADMRLVWSSRKCLGGRICTYSNINYPKGIRRSASSEFSLINAIRERWEASANYLLAHLLDGISEIHLNAWQSFSSSLDSTERGRSLRSVCSHPTDYYRPHAHTQ